MFSHSRPLTLSLLTALFAVQQCSALIFLLNSYDCTKVSWSVSVTQAELLVADFAVFEIDDGERDQSIHTQSGQLTFLIIAAATSNVIVTSPPLTISSTGDINLYDYSFGFTTYLNGSNNLSEGSSWNIGVSTLHQGGPAEY